MLRTLLVTSGFWFCGIVGAQSPVVRPIVPISQGGTGSGSFTPGRCIQVAPDGSRFESAPGACTAAGALHGDLTGRELPEQHPAAAITFAAYGGVADPNVQLAIQSIIDGWLPRSERNVANGVAGLDASTKLDRTQLPVMVGDSGSGGQAGAVPAPAAGDAAKCLRGDGTWGTCGTTTGSGVPNQRYSFSGATSLTVTGATHAFGHERLHSQCFDTTVSPAEEFQPAKITVNQTTFDVVWTFSQAKTGYCTLSGWGGVPTGWIALPVAGCSGATGYLLWDTLPTGAPTANCSAGLTNSALMRASADFPDQDGDYSLQQALPLPPDWKAPLDLYLKWRAGGTTGDVVWQAQTACVADGDIQDVSWNTTILVDTAKPTADQVNDAVLTNVTTTGCATGELLHLRILRNRTHAQDTIAGTVSLLAAAVQFRR